MRQILLLSFFLISFSSSTFAASIVDSIQMPAWLVRADSIMALRPGTELVQGDKILTGNNARVYLLLEEGSLIKIGADAEFVIENTDQNVAEEGIFTAIYSVIKGAFRFTTNELHKQRKRHININIGTVTAGIRGTDLWGKSNNTKDLVCLIEGKIAVEHPLAAPIEMDQPKSYTSADKGMVPGPVGIIADQELAEWAQTTELTASGGTITNTGHFGVNLLSVTNHDSAVKASQKFNTMGYASDVVTISIDGIEWHRVAIKGFDSLKDARYFAESINGKYGARTAWVSQYF